MDAVDFINNCRELCDSMETCEACPVHTSKFCGINMVDNRMSAPALVKFMEDCKFAMDWLKVAVNTPILVRNDPSEPWQPGHFARYLEGKICTWVDGKTSWSSNEHYVPWEFAMLASDFVAGGNDDK